MLKINISGASETYRAAGGTGVILSDLANVCAAVCSGLDCGIDAEILIYLVAALAAENDELTTQEIKWLK